MRPPLEPGYYWVRVPGESRPVVAEWVAAESERWPYQGWQVYGYHDEAFTGQDELVRLSERLVEPRS